MKKLIFLITALIVLGGCFTAQTLTDQPMVEYDKHTEYSISDDDGDSFTLTVYYSKYKFWLSREEITWEAFEKLKEIARVIAEKQGKEIQPIKREDLITSYGRNAVTSTTYCHCQANVKYVG